jgi:hypothetical protein
MPFFKEPLLSVSEKGFQMVGSDSQTITPSCCDVPSPHFAFLLVRKRGQTVKGTTGSEEGSAHTQYEDVLGATGQIQSIHSSPRCTRFSSFPTIVFNSLHFRAVDFTLLGRASLFLGSLTVHIHCQVTHYAVPFVSLMISRLQG